MKCASVIFALRRVILLRSYMMLRIVILSFGQFRGEYNITETARFQYHFCLQAKISLQTIVCNSTLPAEKNTFYFSASNIFSKYVTHYDTFTILVQSVFCFVKIKNERDNFFTKCLSRGFPFYLT